MQGQWLWTRQRDPQGKSHAIEHMGKVLAKPQHKLSVSMLAHITTVLALHKFRDFCVVAHAHHHLQRLPWLAVAQVQAHAITTDAVFVARNK